MFKHTQRSTWYLVVTVALILAGPLATEGRADFILWNDEQLTVTTLHSKGWLYDQGQARIVSGGSVTFLYAYGSSAVDISGGSVSSNLYAYDSSAVNLFGGDVGYLEALNTSTVNISGGLVSILCANNSSAVDISGGSVSTLRANNTSTVTFNARGFRLGYGLSLDGDQVLGTGILIGEWFDGTRSVVDISVNASGATILAIPEPATLFLLAFGGLAVIRRRRRQK